MCLMLFTLSTISTGIRNLQKKIHAAHADKLLQYPRGISVAAVAPTSSYIFEELRVSFGVTMAATRVGHISTS